jgi:hypothetical protein
MPEAMARLPLLVASAALFAAAAPCAPARAADKAAECLHAFSAAALAPSGKPRIKCVDNDPTCDTDPTPGICRIDVSACLNVTDPTGVCAPRDLEDYLIANVQPDTEPLHDFEFQTLQDAVTSMGLPADTGDTDLCIGPVEMVLPLEVRIGKKGARYGKSKELLDGRVQGPEGALDEDALPMKCVPAKGSDPCATVASTLEHLEQHVFSPTCSRDTCHSGPQSDHTLSLLAGEAYANLVDVDPDNATARLAGKKRVDPGNPDNSFLLDKLRGTLTMDEGERMPRGLPKIPAREIALIEAWIAAGAPAAGFVDGPGCQGP